MKLCVLMPAYNEEKYIQTAIGSVFADQRQLDISLIIVDDGSTDNTAKIVSELCKTNSNIQLIQQKNQGISAARNALLLAIPTSCDLVTFLDADDVFIAGWLAQQCARFEPDPSLALVYGQICTIESDEQDLAAQPRTDSLISRSISLSCGVFRPWLLKKTGVFASEFEQGEDMDYLLRMFEAGPKKFLSDEIAVLYRQHSGNATKDSATLRRGFTRAIFHHIVRRKKDPSLVSVAGIFKLTQMPDALKFRRR